MVGVKQKFQYQISDQCRKSKKAKEVFLKWVEANPKFKNRKPTVEETVKEMTKGCLKSLVEQNEKEAAKIYWRAEAQYWLRHVEVVRVNIKTGDLSKPVNAFPAIRRGCFGRIAESDYESMRRVPIGSEKAFSIVDQAKADLEAWLNRYERYSEFLKVFDSVIPIIRCLLEKE